MKSSLTKLECANILATMSQTLRRERNAIIGFNQSGLPVCKANCRLGDFRVEIRVPVFSNIYIHSVARLKFYSLIENLEASGEIEFVGSKESNSDHGSDSHGDSETDSDDDYERNVRFLSRF